MLGSVGESCGYSGGFLLGTRELDAVESSSAKVISDANDTCDGAHAALSSLS